MANLIDFNSFFASLNALSGRPLTSAEDFSRALAPIINRTSRRGKPPVKKNPKDPGPSGAAMQIVA